MEGLKLHAVQICLFFFLSNLTSKSHALSPKEGWGGREQTDLERQRQRHRQAGRWTDRGGDGAVCITLQRPC